MLILFFFKLNDLKLTPIILKLLLICMLVNFVKVNSFWFEIKAIKFYFIIFILLTSNYKSINRCEILFLMISFITFSSILLSGFFNRYYCNFSDYVIIEINPAIPLEDQCRCKGLLDVKLNHGNRHELICLLRKCCIESAIVFCHVRCQYVILYWDGRVLPYNPPFVTSKYTFCANKLY